MITYEQRKKEQILRTKLTSDIIKFICKGKKYTLTEEYAVKVLLKYFPRANEIFKGTVKCYCTDLQNLFYLKLDLEDQIHEYLLDEEAEIIGRRNTPTQYDLEREV